MYYRSVQDFWPWQWQLLWVGLGLELHNFDISKLRRQCPPWMSPSSLLNPFFFFFSAIGLLNKILPCFVGFTLFLLITCIYRSYNTTTVLFSKFYWWPFSKIIIPSFQLPLINVLEMLFLFSLPFFPHANTKLNSYFVKLIPKYWRVQVVE